ncbi:MAG: DUF5615 family PIN-like protein, partial [Bacteroidota bacterium]
AISLFMDQHIPRAITNGLILREVDVITAYEDGSSAFEDPDLLDRATELGRVLFTFDDDLLAEAKKRQAKNIPFGGVVFAKPLKVSIGACIRDLEIISKAGEPEDLLNQVQFLPL